MQPVDGGVPAPLAKAAGWGTHLRRAGLPAAWAAGGLLILALGGADVGTVGVLSRIVMFMALAVGWNVLGGFAGYLNLGMATFFGVGAYGAALAAGHLGTPLAVNVLLGGVVAAAVGLVIGILTLPLRGAYFAIFTFVSVFIVQAVATNIGLTGGAMGVSIAEPPWSLAFQTRVWYWGFAVVFLLATAASARIRSSRFGAALLAVREDEDAAEVLGVATVPVKLGAFLIGAFVGGAVGAVYAYQQTFIYPSTIFDVSTSIEVVLGAAAGGGTYWLGPVVGMPLVLAVSSLLRLAAGQVLATAQGIPVQVDRLIYGVLLVVVGLFFRHGLVGAVARARRRRARPASPGAAEEAEASGATG